MKTQREVALELLESITDAIRSRYDSNLPPWTIQKLMDLDEFLNGVVSEEQP